ncbi:MULTISPECIES: hypothetical protein [Nocardia]|uniref:WXG100 family type VII secretion target n=1 Tax=Nocardia xishanensis TaxID=238964 RepID=A0ABW7X920_9NOCA|nr:hypothetical protein [Nocardia xishanensis]
MKYTKQVHDQLISEMDQYYKDLDGYKDAFVAAKDKLVTKGWEESEALESFTVKANSLLEELNDTHTKMQALRNAIDGAFNNAFAADKKVYNSF